VNAQESRNMIDSYGRKIDYLRISVTDRCNLRCKYCMPKEGVNLLSHDDILSYDEIVRLSGIFSELGIERIKLTGGEPLVRKGLPNLIRELKKIPGIKNVTLTTNGIELSKYISELEDAGLDGINVSLDTLDSDKFRDITGEGELGSVLQGIDECLEHGKVELKVNTVLFDDADEKEYIDLIEYFEGKNVKLRFIEMMPIGLGSEFVGRKASEVFGALEDKYGKASVSNLLGAGPAKYYRFADLNTEIGFISAISHSFCETCNRVRLTSEGKLRQCLAFDNEIDLKSCLRNGANDSELKEIITSAIFNKPKGHLFSKEGSGKTIMSKIGG